MKFRTLKANEIDCRVATINDKGLTLLLYKDARADMNLLDETVGSEKWQRKHDVINNNLFCSVGIKIGDEWIWKQDVGTESYTEKEKGQASDSFKRACTNWGIGRELYDAPFIWISADKFNLKEKNGKYGTYDKFEVKTIDYDDNRKIIDLEIVNTTKNITVFKLGQKVESKKVELATKEQIEKITELAKELKITTEQSIDDLAHFKKSGLKDLTTLEANSYIKILQQRIAKGGKNGK